jgi:hypothetical protein
VRLAGIGIVLLATGLFAIGLAMDGVFGESDESKIAYRDLSFRANMQASARQVSGDCVSADIVYAVEGTAQTSGDIPGSSEYSYTTTFPIENGCRLGYAEGSIPIVNGQGTGISALNFALVPVANPINGQPTGQSDQPGSVLMVTGLGDHEGLSGPGRCNIPQTSIPTSPTELRLTGEGDCFVRLGETGDQQAVFLEGTTNWLSMSPVDGQPLAPSSIILAAFYMNDSDEPLDGLRLRIPQPAGASLAVAYEDEEFVAAHDRSWSLPEIGPGEVARFFVNVQLVASSRDEIVVIPEIYGEGLDEPVRSSPLRLRVVQ